MGGGEGRRREGVAERGECGGTGHGEEREDRTGRGRMGCVCVSGRVGRSVRVGMAGCSWVLVHTYAQVCGKSVHQCAHVCTRVHTCALVFTRVHTCALVFSRVHSCSHVCSDGACPRLGPVPVLGWVLCVCSAGSWCDVRVLRWLMPSVGVLCLCSVGSCACARLGHGAMCVRSVGSCACARLGLGAMCVCSVGPRGHFLLKPFAVSVWLLRYRLFLCFATYSD